MSSGPNLFWVDRKTQTHIKMVFQLIYFGWVAHPHTTMAFQQKNSLSLQLDEPLLHPNGISAKSFLGGRQTRFSEFCSCSIFLLVDDPRSHWDCIMAESFLGSLPTRFFQNRVYVDIFGRWKTQEVGRVIF